MNKSHFYKDFKQWLKLNRHLFAKEPYISQVRKNHFKVYFHGLKNHLFLEVSKTGTFSVWSYLEARDPDGPLVIADWLLGLDYKLKRNHTGYYCALYRENSVSLDITYPTKRNFLEKHCYETFLEWFNDKFKNADSIIFYENHTDIMYERDLKSKDRPLFILKY